MPHSASVAMVPQSSSMLYYSMVDLPFCKITCAATEFRICLQWLSTSALHEVGGARKRTRRFFSERMIQQTSPMLSRLAGPH
jgi:hypothetical protein